MMHMLSFISPRWPFDSSVAIKEDKEGRYVHCVALLLMVCWQKFTWFSKVMLFCFDQVEFTFNAIS